MAGFRFELVPSETFAPPKVSDTSKAVQGGGKKRKSLRLSFSSPLLENPPPYSSFSLAPLAPVGRPQNRSGIRNPLTRSDLVRERLLLQRFKASRFLDEKH
ncbi:MAG: hypothetical protein HEQ32_00785 [Vampirovibrio sp.]